jgi:hypothetical protein
MEQRRTFRRLAAIISLTCIIANTLAAQAPPKAAAPAKDKTAAARAGWSGVVTYKKSRNDSFNSDEKLPGKIDESERIKHDDTHTMTYSSSIVVRDPNGTGRPQTVANISSVEKRSNKVIQTELTNCHSHDPSRLITAESTDRQTTRGNRETEAKSFNVSVSGERFQISFALPEIVGQYTKESNTTYKNLCGNSTRKPSNSSSDSVTLVSGAGASVDGLIDQNNPDVIKGFKTWTDGVYTNSKGVTHSVTWRLTRKPQPLIIADVKFYEPLYPSPSDWHEIGEKDRSVDGNQVKVVATVVNLGSTDKTTSVNFKELKENSSLGDGPVSATIPANGQKDVELIWDTSGYAWRQAGADVVPEMQRQVEVTMPDDKMQKDLKVIPKPVVVVWGFWQSGSAIDDFHNYFKVFNPDWGVWSSRSDWTKVSTDNADVLDRDVRGIQKRINAWHVDLVSSTNGGLVGRVYVNSKMPTQFDGRPTATHLVMVGVPNKGTPCATGLFGLSFRINTLSLDAVSELSPDSMKRFNLLVNNTNGTKFAALAVHSRYTCQDDVAGDGLTPVRSAIWRTKTNFVSHQNVWVREMMSEVTHFRQVVKWIAIPPKGDHAPDPQTLAVNDLAEPMPFDTVGGERFNTRHYGAMYAGQPTDDTDQKADFAQVIRVQGGKTIDVPISVKAGTRFSLQMLASEDVNATLIDDKGEVLGQNLGADSVREVFRSIAVTKPFAAGTWKIRLENRGKQETELAVLAFIDYPLEEK